MAYSESCFFPSDTKAKCVNLVPSLSSGFPDWPEVYINNSPFLVVAY